MGSAPGTSGATFAERGGHLLHWACGKGRLASSARGGAQGVIMPGICSITCLPTQSGPFRRDPKCNSAVGMCVWGERWSSPAQGLRSLSALTVSPASPPTRSASLTQPGLPSAALSGALPPAASSEPLDSRCWREELGVRSPSLSAQEEKAKGNSQGGRCRVQPHARNPLASQACSRKGRTQGESPREKTFRTTRVPSSPGAAVTERAHKGAAQESTGSSGDQKRQLRTLKATGAQEKLP